MIRQDVFRSAFGMQTAGAGPVKKGLLSGWEIEGKRRSKRSLDYAEAPRDCNEIKKEGRKGMKGSDGRYAAAERTVLGRRGEDAALDFLLESGLKLVARNWRSGHKELDLVMEDGKFVRFIEVKTLAYPHAAEPFRSVGIRKQRKIICAARHFMGEHGMGKEAVFDVVSVVFRDGRFGIEYFPDAFVPIW